MLWVWGMEDLTTPALWRLKTLLLGVWRLSSLVIRSTVLLANMQTMFDEAWTLFNPTRDRVWSFPWWDGKKEYFWPKKGKVWIKKIVTFYTFFNLYEHFTTHQDSVLETPKMFLANFKCQILLTGLPPIHNPLGLRIISLVLSAFIFSPSKFTSYITSTHNPKDQNLCHSSSTSYELRDF